MSSAGTAGGTVGKKVQEYWTFWAKPYAGFVVLTVSRYSGQSVTICMTQKEWEAMRDTIDAQARIAATHE